MSTDTSNVSICTECGMECGPGEYHPYAACLMFKQCRSSEVVNRNLEAVIEYGGRRPQAGQYCASEWLDANQAVATKQWIEGWDACLVANRIPLTTRIESETSTLAAGCHRSHPHENMNAECERLTEIAREQNRRANETSASQSTNTASAVSSGVRLALTRHWQPGIWGRSGSPHPFRPTCLRTPRDGAPSATALGYACSGAQASTIRTTITDS